MPATAPLLAFLLLIQIADSGRDSLVTRLVVIASPTTATTNISIADLRRVYLGSITRWPDGNRIVPVVLRKETRQQRAFLKHVLQMNDIDYGQHWIGQVFRGRASAPPHVAASAAEARRYVASHPYAIAIIAAEDVDDASVLKLSIDGKSAEAEDYPLMW